MSVSFLLELVCIGGAGAVGAVTRYLLGHVVASRVRGIFPVGTVIINVSGSFLIGLVFALAARHIVSPTLQLVLATGFLGGYTTFSTMSWEGVQLVRAGTIRASVLYVSEHVILGLLASVAGIALGGWL